MDDNHDVYMTMTSNRSCNVLKVNPSEKKKQKTKKNKKNNNNKKKKQQRKQQKNNKKTNSIRCQTYAKTEDHIELKLYFNSRHPRHRFSAQRKMQHLCIAWRDPCFWRLDFCQIIKSCSGFWMDQKSKQVYSLIDRFRSIYDVRR